MKSLFKGVVLVSSIMILSGCSHATNVQDSIPMTTNQAFGLVCEAFPGMIDASGSMDQKRKTMVLEALNTVENKGDLTPDQKQLTSLTKEYVNTNGKINQEKRNLLHKTMREVC